MNAMTTYSMVFRDWFWCRGDMVTCEPTTRTRDGEAVWEDIETGKEYRLIKKGGLPRFYEFRKEA